MLDMIAEVPTVETAPPQTTAPDLDDPRLYINRELSQLEFFRRVLEEAQNERNPLLERVKFLAIVHSNLDEFFMVRVAGIKDQIAAGALSRWEDDPDPAQLLAAIRKAAHRLMAEARDTFIQDLLPALDRAGIHILNYDQLSDEQRGHVGRYFDEVVFPVLTPLAFDPGRPFPHISNLSLNLAVLIRSPDGRERFARLKVPNTLPRLAPIRRSSGGTRKDGTVPHHHFFVWLEQAIVAHLDALFPGMQVVEAHPFRVTRNADVIIQELEAADLLETMEASIRERRFGSAVRLAINDGMPKPIREILIENLELDRNDLYGIDRKDLKDAPFVPALPTALNGRRGEADLFGVIRREDVILHHPYDSFLPVIEFLRLAANDPDVLAIKQTLYRVGQNAPVVEALLEAAQNGKQVAVLVELKARFDEESNIGWARTLENEGVHVIYGLLGLKTHSKIALVVRKEGDHIRRYTHMATGNYNAVTATLYTDLSLFTCDEAVGADASDLFNYLTGYSAKQDYHKLLVAPINLRSRLEALIRREIEHQHNGGDGHLIFKMNAIVDRPVIRRLYEASQAGVKVDLLVRSICCLRPGVAGVSDNIRVTSVVGRFLEHSRIYYFHNGGQEEVYLGSADLMPRNIDRRVEILFPVEQPALVRFLRDDVLETYLADNVCARRLLPDGSYQRLQPGPDEAAVNSQAVLLERRARGG